MTKGNRTQQVGKKEGSAPSEVHSTKRIRQFPEKFWFPVHPGKVKPTSFRFRVREYIHEGEGERGSNLPLDCDIRIVEK